MVPLVFLKLFRICKKVKWSMYNAQSNVIGFKNLLWHFDHQNSVYRCQTFNLSNTVLKCESEGDIRYVKCRYPCRSTIRSWQMELGDYLRSSHCRGVPFRDAGPRGPDRLGHLHHASSERYPAFSLVELLHCCALIGRELQSDEIFSCTARSYYRCP